jgi:hypothetical protein
MCPIRRTWNQVLLLDPAEELFVSREMVGRKHSSPIVRRALQSYFKVLKLEEEYRDLLEKPQRLSEADNTALKQASDFLWDNFVLAARGVPDINQIQKAFMKQYFPSRMDFREGS